MPDTIRVVAVEGRMLPVPNRAGEYVGYRRARGDDKPDVQVPRGNQYTRITEPVEVASSPYMRRAIERGDIARAPEAVETPKDGE